MAERAFTSAEKAARLHRKLCNMAIGFDLMLTTLVRDPALGAVFDQLLLRGEDGDGVVLRISAEFVPAAEVAAAEARMREAGR